MENESRTRNDEKLERELDALFTAYRDACPAPEPGPDFMPRLWERIEARRSVSYSFTRLTQAFVTAAAAICLLLTILQTTLKNQPIPLAQSYVETLAQASVDDNPAYTEINLYEFGGVSY
jgi:hypothetical protein